MQQYSSHPPNSHPQTMTEKSRINAIVVFDIDGVIRDVSGSYRRALADTVEYFTNAAYRPTPVDIDQLKSEGIWNNDWEASQEMIYRFFETQQQPREQLQLEYKTIVAFFQSKYRGTEPQHLTGYICDEPLLLQPKYLESLTTAGIKWGFFSGATRVSATYVLEKRLGLSAPTLIAMEDAPGKPDPTGLFDTIKKLEVSTDNLSTVFYVGDTVADMYTILKARELAPHRQWIAVGVLPPHVQKTASRKDEYAASLINAGADIVFCNVQDLTPARVVELVNL
jgi:HAD superfamily phosphatase